MNGKWPEITRLALACVGVLGVGVAYAQNVNDRLTKLEVKSELQQALPEEVEKLRLDQALTRKDVQQVGQTVQEIKALLLDRERRERNRQ